MPVSIDTVRETSSGSPRSFGTVYPSTNPPRCSPSTAPSSGSPAPAKEEEVWAMTDPQMSATNITQSSGVTPETDLDRPGSLVLISSPSATGASTTWRVERRRPDASTGTSEPASSDVISGVMIGAAHVDTVVISTDSATSACAIKVTRLEAVPPGHAETRISPTASGTGSANSFAMLHPRSGINVNWHAKPRKTSRGFFSTRLKSLNSRVMPMKSMVEASAAVMYSPLSHLSISGWNIPTPAPARTQNGKRFVSREITFMILFGWFGSDAPPRTASVPCA
mmetsp:Transcript_68934/g.164433  ORF Transcript_68934/g.164433 Transcript_68934/m.164433 type:complete len:281 (+) Transcript_68934:356-1198(+)